jgi:hypothetical protein
MYVPKLGNLDLAFRMALVPETLKYYTLPSNWNHSGLYQK